MKSSALSRKQVKNLRIVAQAQTDLRRYNAKGVEMLNKTIVGILGVTILTGVGIFVFRDVQILYVGFGLIATLCGVTLIKNGFFNKK